MPTWTRDDLDRIGSADELEIAPLGSDGAAGKPVTIWVVQVGNDLYVRSYKGRTSHWFRRAQVRHQAHIRAGGIAKDVTLVEVNSDADLNNRVDAAYRTKYRRYAKDIVESVVTPVARAATLKLEPRPAS